jgi:hypothetical protein
MPSPAAQAIPNEVKRANSAAASAGTICSGSVTESSCTSEAASTPTVPATRHDSRVLTMESWLGDSPASTAAPSFSEAARVARPNRLQRYSAHSATAKPTTTPVRMNRSTGTVTLPSFTVAAGRMAGAGLAAVPKPSSMAACASSSTPSEAASLASGDAARSGRKAPSSISTPTSSTTTSVTTSAGTVPSVRSKKKPVFSDQKV